MLRSLLLFAFSIFCTCHGVQDNVLNLLVLAPFSSDYHHTPVFSQGHSLIPAVELAVEHINNSTHILPNHTLEIIVGDSGCNVSTETALPFVQNVVTDTRPVLGIVGPACTEASLVLAEITQKNRYGIVQAMMATSDVLEDHKSFRHTFGMLSSFNILVDTLLNIAMENSWNNIGVLYDASREFFQRTFNSFASRSENIPNFVYNSWPVLAPDYIKKPIDRLVANGTHRVIFAVMSAQTARHVACLAGIMGLTYPKYQFVYADRSVDNFMENANFNGTNPKYICNESVILKGLNGSILLRYGLNSTGSQIFLNDTAKVTVGEVKNQYTEKLRQYGNHRGLNLSESVYAYPYYDATWAVAMSVDKALKELGSFTPSNFRFLNNSREAEIIRQKFAALDFQGTSVHVKFNKQTGHVTSKVDMFQVNGQETTTNMTNITFIPDDFEVNLTQLHPSLIALGLTITCVALVLTFLLHFVNIYYRDHSTIKASSPRLNQFIFTGCYLIILTVFLKTIEEGFFKHGIDTVSREVVCNLNVFLYPVCLTLIISTVCVKLWRLYSIFSRSFKKQRLIYDQYLALIVLALLVAVITCSVPWLAAARFEEKQRVTFIVNGVITEKQIEAFCSPTSDYSVLLAVPFMLVILLSAYTFSLAYLNRKIRNNQYRSKESIIFTYLFSLILGIFALVIVLTYILGLNVHISYSLNTIVLLSVVFLCDFVLFVPPIYPIIDSKLNCYKSSLRCRFKKTLSKDHIVK